MIYYLDQQEREKHCPEVPETAPSTLERTNNFDRDCDYHRENQKHFHVVSPLKNQKDTHLHTYRAHHHNFHTDQNDSSSSYLQNLQKRSYPSLAYERNEPNHSLLDIHSNHIRK